jgi:hypothetical protein
MNGNIMVESKPNMGTTFKNLYSMIKKKIWVIDDDEIYKLSLLKSFKKRICSRLFLPSATGKMD